MPLVNRKRPKLGDVIEIKTPKGFAYAQYTYKHDAPPKYGALLRIFHGFYNERPNDFANIVNMQPQIITFFPLGAACNRGIVQVVANEEIPEGAKSLPTFRAGVPNKDGKIETWWLWDGENEWKIGKLAAGMEKYPIRGIWSYTVLIQRIVDGWCHEKVT